jgi:hypothetical protein
MRSLRRWIVPVAATLVVLSGLPADAATREGTWRGDTSQDFRVRFIVGDDERIKDITIKIEYENDTCVRTVTWGFGLDVRIRDDDTFRLRLADDADDRDTAVIRGEFVTRRRAEGTFRGTFSDGGACNDLGAKGTWVAKRV